MNTSGMPCVCLSMTKKNLFKCPNCGNRNPAKFQDNGLRLNDPELTLICVARVAPGADTFLGAANPPLDVGFDGKVACSAQWSPHE